MKAITKTYLAEIIFRAININIDKHREGKQDKVYQQFPCATNGEMLDFIQSTPYFDNRLKDFLVGNLEEETIIVSQSWEIEFLKKTRLWADSNEWLSGDKFLTDFYINSIRNNNDCLTLPY